MSTRSLVKVLVAMYLNSKGLRYAPVRDVANVITQTGLKVDAYRIVYGLGLHDPGFAIEKDEENTYIRVVG